MKHTLRALPLILFLAFGIPVAGSSLPGGITQQEIDWALQLENRVKDQNYSPTPQEIEAYQGIAKRLEAGLPSTPADSTTTRDSSHSLPSTVSEEELQWALSLEEKVSRQNHQPTAQESARYVEIAKKLQSGKAPNQPSRDEEFWPRPYVVPQTDLDWATELQNQVREKGYNPTPQEIARYTDIFNRYQANPNGPIPAPSDSAKTNAGDTDLVWAMDLLSRHRAGYTPTAAELKRYESIVGIAPATKTSKTKSSRKK